MGQHSGISLPTLLKAHAQRIVTSHEKSARGSRATCTTAESAAVSIMFPPRTRAAARRRGRAESNEQIAKGSRSGTGSSESARISPNLLSSLLDNLGLRQHAAAARRFQLRTGIASTRASPRWISRPTTPARRRCTDRAGAQTNVERTRREPGPVVLESRTARPARDRRDGLGFDPARIDRPAIGGSLRTCASASNIWAVSSQSRRPRGRKSRRRCPARVRKRSAA